MMLANLSVGGLKAKCLALAVCPSIYTEIRRLESTGVKYKHPATGIVGDTPWVRVCLLLLNT